MKTLQEYWDTDPETQQSEANQLAYEALSLDSKQVVLKAKHAVKAAIADRDAYITALKDHPAPDLNRVVEHQLHIDQLEDAYEAAQNVHNALFETNNA